MDAALAPEGDDLAEALGRLQNPEAVILDDLLDMAVTEGFKTWLRDPKSSRSIPHRMDEVGYVPVHNRDDQRGRWQVGGRQRIVYVRKDLEAGERLAAARRRAGRWTG